MRPLHILVLSLAVVLCQDWHLYINNSLEWCLSFHDYHPQSIGIMTSSLTSCIVRSWLPCRRVNSQCDHNTNFPCGLTQLPTSSSCSHIVWKMKVQPDENKFSCITLKAIKEISNFQVICMLYLSTTVILLHIHSAFCLSRLCHYLIST